LCCTHRAHGRRLWAATAAAALVGGLTLVGPLPAQAATVTVPFAYNGTNGTDGSAQSWVVPAGVTQVTAVAYGAAGGPGSLPGASGLGGSATATLSVTPGETLQINVGGAGGSGAGFNGGGAGADPAVGGGGASDVRRGGTSLAHRVLVAGGGGADGDSPGADPAGGDGGGLSGTPGEDGGGGGTQEGPGDGGPGGGCDAGDPGEAGALGQGGAGVTGGGGGYYGGGGGGSCVILDTGGVTYGGGGGSGFGPAGVAFETGVRSGHGAVSISYVLPTVTITPATGASGTGVSVIGAGYGASEQVVVKYRTGLAHPKAHVLCTTTAQPDGSFSCSGTVPTTNAGALGAHEILGKGKTSATKALTTFTRT
jgi:hypothetical protein